MGWVDLKNIHQKINDFFLIIKIRTESFFKKKKNMIGVLLKYSDFFSDKLPLNKFDLVKNIPRVELIATVSAVNHTIKSALSVDFDDSWENQLRQIELIY
jgi:hypothetical protein